MISCSGFRHRGPEELEKNETRTPKAHTHLVCHLSELVNDGSYQIKTRQHIKTAVSPSTFSPTLLVFLCLSVSLSFPLRLASIISPICSIPLIPKRRNNILKWHKKLSYLHKHKDYRWTKWTNYLFHPAQVYWNRPRSKYVKTNVFILLGRMLEAE